MAESFSNPGSSPAAASSSTAAKYDTAIPSSSSTQQSSSSSRMYRAPQILEINEELISACVENLQLGISYNSHALVLFTSALIGRTYCSDFSTLYISRTGRLDECMKHYTLLQKNITTLGLEVDNFPLDVHECPEKAIEVFPDKIIRKDVLEELLTPDPDSGLAVLAEAPLPPPCADCIAPYLASNRHKRNLAYRCRVELKHTNPSYKFTASERNEFLAVVELLEERRRQLGQQSNAVKRNYKRWSPDEKHTILIVSVLFGLKHQSKVSEFLVGRNENQIRSFINKKLDPIELTALSTGMKPLPPPPKGYIPPQKLLEELKRRSDAGEDVSAIQNSFSNLNNIRMPETDTLGGVADSGYSVSVHLERETTAASIYAGETVSQVAATSGGWSLMLSMASDPREPHEKVIGDSDGSGEEEKVEGDNDDDDDDDSVDTVVNRKKRRAKLEKIPNLDTGVIKAADTHGDMEMKPVPSHGRLQDKYGEIVPVSTQYNHQQQEPQSPSSSSGVNATTGESGSSSTGLAAEAAVKILSDTIKILGSKLESVSSTKASSRASSNQIKNDKGNTKKQITSGKRSYNKSSKVTKSASKKAVKDRLKIETGGRRGKAKFDQLFDHHETDGNIYDRGNGSEIICEDSNSGLLDPSLPLADGADILQSPMKLVSFSGTKSETTRIYSPNSNVDSVILNEAISAKKVMKKGGDKKKLSAKKNELVDIKTEVKIPDTSLSETLLGISSDITHEFSQFALPHVTSETPVQIMGEQTMDSFSLLPHGSEEFSML